MSITLDGTAGVTAPSFNGPVTGTTGTFSGALQANGIAANIYAMQQGTAQASTSGTAIDFTGIPSWAKRITVLFNGVSLSGTSLIQVQLGSGSFVAAGYNSASTTGTTNSSSTAGFLVTAGAATAAQLCFGSVVLTVFSGNTWVESGVVSQSSWVSNSGGALALIGVLDRVRITTLNGTDTFDAGSINIMWEG